MKTMNNYAIILAAGKGTRMNDNNKILININNMPALKYSLDAFNNNDNIDHIILVCPKNMVLEYTDIISGWNIDKLNDIIEGGESRTTSVYNGLNAVPITCDNVLMHDAARPMINDKCIEKVLADTIKYNASLAAYPVANTLKYAKNLEIINTVDRRDVYEVYTPQGFKYSLIKRAYEKAVKENLIITDDAGAVETLGEKVHLSIIDYRDIKLTTHDDIKQVERLLNEDISRIGIGYDVHRLAENRKLVLGGIEIPFHKGLLGHSDADVLVHAIIDSLLGGAGLGDIGHLFPDTSDEFKDVYSINLLKKVINIVYKKHYFIKNIDSVIVCERPKIAPYKKLMIECISDALSCNKSCINIKATTTEGLGFEGKEEGISAYATTLLGYRADENHFVCKEIK